jgi:hypothetical protein
MRSQTASAREAVYFESASLVPRPAQHVLLRAETLATLMSLVALAVVYASMVRARTRHVLPSLEWLVTTTPGPTRVAVLHRSAR